ncbi:MAG: S9 family peptidase [Acidobacteria bacterium]|nr:S9 family peptidase [Acidobacteriota bacterium]
MKTVARILVLVCLSVVLAAAQGDVLAPGDNLVVEGIPPIPASLADAVSRYTDYRAAFLQSWHPTKREMLISTRFGDTNQIHQVKFPGGARTQLTFYPDRVGGASYPRTQGDYFVFSKDIGGGEWFQKYRYNISTGNVTLLTDGKSRNTGGTWSNKGDLYAYQSTRRTGRTSDVYVMNPADPKTDRLVLEVPGGGWGALDWSPDDKQLLVGEYVSINESYLYLLDLATGEKKLITPKGGSEKVSYSGAEFSRDGKGLYVTTDKDSEFQRLTYMDLATGQHTYLTSHINWDVDAFELSPDGKTIAFVTNEDGASVLRLLDTATGKEKPAPKLPAGQVFGIEWHENGRDLGFTLVSARSTADVYSLDVQTGKVERWTTSETAGLNTEAFSEPELIHWKSFDGRMISGYLYRPPTRFTDKRPVIINIHGGPEGQFQPGFMGRWNYFLNELGVALIFPNVRGSSGYGKTFLQLDNGFLREHSYWDINTLLDWIPTRAELDPERIMVTGGSYGGFMTLAVATNYDDRIRCSVDVVGVSNLVTFLENTESYRRDLRRVEYGDERDPKMREFLERIAPVNNAHKITKPLFVVQGANDPRVPRTESEQMVATVRKNDTHVWYLMAKDEGHGFAKKKNQDFQFYSTVLFIQEHLLK